MCIATPFWVILVLDSCQVTAQQQSQFSTLHCVAVHHILFHGGPVVRGIIDRKTMMGSPFVCPQRPPEKIALACFLLSERWSNLGRGYERGCS